MKKVMFVVLIMMLLLAMAIPAFAAPAEKVDVCHLTSSETNEWVLINISDNAWETHEAHGDARVGETVDENCEPLIPTCTVRDYDDNVAKYEVPEGGFIYAMSYYSIVIGDVGFILFNDFEGDRLQAEVCQEGTLCAPAHVDLFSPNTTCEFPGPS